jgi:hypothetical protein
MLTGCAGHFVVKPTTPGSSAPGFRYYLPKPYLLVTNMNIAADDTSNPSKPADNAGAQAPNGVKPKDAAAPAAAVTPPPGTVVTVKLVWLPDTATPYSVTIAGAGIGTFKGGLQLTNGWMLTNVSEESDAKIAETITAVAGLVSDVLSPGGAKGNKALNVTPGRITPFLYLFEIDPANHKLTRVDTSALDAAIAATTFHQDTPPAEK